MPLTKGTAAADSGKESCSGAHHCPSPSGFCNKGLCGGSQQGAKPTLVQLQLKDNPSVMEKEWA